MRLALFMSTFEFPDTLAATESIAIPLPVAYTTTNVLLATSYTSLLSTPACVVASSSGLTVPRQNPAFSSGVTVSAATQVYLLSRSLPAALAANSTRKLRLMALVLLSRNVPGAVLPPVWAWAKRAAGATFLTGVADGTMGPASAHWTAISGEFFMAESSLSAVNPYTPVDPSRHITWA